MQKKLKELEIYEPKKTTIEKIRNTPKIVLILIFSIILITGTFYFSYSFLKNNPDFAQKILGFQKEPDIRHQESTSKSSEPISTSKTTKTSSAKQATSDNNPITTDYSTLIQDLLKSDFIKELPKNAKIQLGFYNFNTGTRKWERFYILEKNSVKQGKSSENDMFIFIHSKYVIDFRKNDLCDVTKKANTNGDFGFETEKSQTALSWKYKSMLKYKDCLGI